MSANNDTPRGFWPAVGVGGSKTPRVRDYAIRAGGASIGQGDVVILTATGASLLVSTGSSLILGVAQHQWTSGGSIRTLKVFDDPWQQFIGQHDGSVTTTAVGANFSVTITTRQTTTLMSQMEIDSSTSNAAPGTLGPTNRPLKMVALSRRINDSTSGNTWVDAVVEFNPAAHVRAKTGAGI